MGDVCKGRNGASYTLIKRKVTRASHKIAFVADSVPSWCIIVRGVRDRYAILRTMKTERITNGRFFAFSGR